MAKTVTKTKAAEALVIDQEPAEKFGAISLATQQVVSLMSTALNNPKLDVRKMRDIMDMQMDMLRYQAQISFNKAMTACQAEIPQIEAKRTNKHTQSKYADLSDIDKIIRPIYIKHGFALNSTSEQIGDNFIKVITKVRHEDGHTEEFTMTGELDDGGAKGTKNKTGIQAVGSSSSYLVRYILKMIFNVVVVGEDKDGNKNQPAKPAPDAFAAANAAERGEPPAYLDAENQQQGYMVEAGAVSKKFKTVASAATYLKKILSEMEGAPKQSKIDRLLDNKHILQALEDVAATDTIAALHAIANGDANVK